MAETSREIGSPGATYRVQLTPSFGFAEAAALVDYLAGLGVTHLYASPYLQAAKGSEHGYDVVDHSKVNEELGGETGRAALVEALAKAGLGQVLDIVPNHMAIGERSNHWWWDVLENGPASIYAGYFDVDWDPPEAHMRNRILLPVLPDHYGRVLEAGELSIEREGPRLVLLHGGEEGQSFPLSPTTVAALLEETGARAVQPPLELLGRALRLVAEERTAGQAHFDREALFDLLEQLLEGDPRSTAVYDQVIKEVSADVERLDQLISQQHYRLAYWRTAGRELDYRRFFDINSLVGIRTEAPAVFQATHRRVLGWVADGSVQGLRVDHPDGLRDPAGYLQRLAEATGGTWTVVEKILEPGEDLPSEWPVAGSTGYEFLNLVDQIFVDPEGESAMTALYGELTGESLDFHEVLYGAKLAVLTDVLGAEVNRLVGRFLAVCARHRRFRDFTRHELHEVLRQVLACMPVYRTYVQAEKGLIHQQDRLWITLAVGLAREKSPDLDPELFGLLGDLLSLEVGPADPLPANGSELSSEISPETDLVMRFQQLSGPAMAKGAEDTAFYIFNRFVALNEVGGDPGGWGREVEDFHYFCAGAQAWRPTAMLSSSTHDTKRSEDVRSRLVLLSEIPEEWSAAVRLWTELNSGNRPAGWQDPNTEYFVYQTLVGAWPIATPRLQAYMAKATKEAKRNTSWTSPNPAYDEGLQGFVEAICADEAFLDAFAGFVEPLVWPGRVNSMAQALIKLTAPGVPDIYQGTELWDLSLVDPDNRRPVDYERRRALLARLDGSGVAEILAGADEGLPKLAVTRTALWLRRRKPEIFGARGSYQPIRIEGDRAGHALCFSRGSEVLTLVPRLVLGLQRAGGFADAGFELPAGNWKNLFTGEVFQAGHVGVAEMLGSFPVALAERI